MPDGVGPDAGSQGGVYGTNMAQSAIDSAQRIISQFASTVSNLNQTVGTIKQSYNSGNKWSVGTPWSTTNGGSTSVPNGGAQTTPSVPPYNPQHSSGNTDYSSESPYEPTHRAENGGGPTMGGRLLSAATYGAAGLGTAMGIGGRLAKSLNGAMGTTLQQQNAGMNTFNTVFDQMVAGPSTYSNLRNAMASNPTLQATGISYQDVAAGQAGINTQLGFAPGTAGQKTATNWLAQNQVLNPGSTAAGNANSMSSFYQMPTTNTLNALGFHTYNQKTGKMVSPANLAEQFLTAVMPTWRTTKWTKGLIDKFLYAPNQPWTEGLSMYQHQGILTSGEVTQIDTYAQGLLKGLASGESPSQTISNLNKSQTSKQAQQDLAKSHIGNNPTTSLVESHAAQRAVHGNAADTYNNAVNDAANGLKGLSDATNSALKNFNWLNSLFNKWEGVQAGRSVSPNGVVGLAGLVLGASRSGISSSESNILQGAGLGTGSSSPFGLGPGGDLGGGTGGAGVPTLSHAGGTGGAGAPTLSHAFASPGPKPAVGGGGGGGGGNSGGGGGGGGGGSNKSGKKTTIHFIYPTKYRNISAGFNEAGSHWASGHHSGVDFPCPTGTPVHASAAGEVVAAGWTPGWGAYGEEVRISHGNGITSLYGHNSRVVVRIGQHVSQGALIAYSGATGNATGPHCHFEIDLNGTRDPVNPIPYLTGGKSAQGSSTGSGGSSSSLGGPGNSTSGAGSPMTGSSDGGGGGGGGGMAISGVGTSELDLLSGLGSGEGGSFGSAGSSSGSTGSAASGGSSMSPSTGSGSSGSSGGGSGSLNIPGNPGGGGSRAANEALMHRMANKVGWSKNWPDLVHLMMGESGFNNTAQNPHSTAYGMFQFLDSTWATVGATKTSDPYKQIVDGFKYIHERYGNPTNAWHKWESRTPHWYDKGAFNLPSDEIAKVHKGEMIIPKAQAQQIREVLLNNNPYGAKGGADIQINFGANSVVINNSGAGGGSSMGTTGGRSIGKAIADAIATDSRIKNLQRGVKL